MENGKMSITIDRDYRDKGVAPLYRQYDGQLKPQPAYIELDEDGTVRAGYSGASVPASVQVGGNHD